MSVSRLENEGFGFVIISSVSRAGSTIGRIIPGEEHVLKLLSCTCQVCSLQGFLVITKRFPTISLGMFLVSERRKCIRQTSAT